MPTHTYTRTWVHVHPADPYLVCGRCAQHVCFWREDEKGPHVNRPCEHEAEIVGLCPSWGPVEGCRCARYLGHVPHGPAPDCPEHGPS